MLALIEKLLVHFDIGKESRLIEVPNMARFLVFARLQQVRTVAGTIERDFALLAAALGTDAPMDRGTESLFLPEIADRTTHAPIISRRTGRYRLLHNFWSNLLSGSR